MKIRKPRLPRDVESEDNPGSALPLNRESRHDSADSLFAASHCVVCLGSARKFSDAIAVDSPRPLHNFPLVRSRDVEEVRSCIARFYSKPVLVPARRAESFDATINAYQFRNIGICYSTFGADIGFEFPPAGVFSQLFPIRGRGEATCGRASFGLSAGAGVVIPPDASHNSNISADYEHLVLRINAQALTEKLAAMTGATITEPLLIDARQSVEASSGTNAGAISSTTCRHFEWRYSAVSRLVDGANRAAANDAISMWAPAQLQSSVAGGAGRHRSAADPASRGIHRSKCEARNFSRRACGHYWRKRLQPV